MKLVLLVLTVAGQVVGINPDEVRKTQNFVNACHNFIKKGSYPTSNDFSDQNRDILNCVQKIIEGSIEAEIDKPARINTAVSLVGDRINNLLGDNKLEDAKQLIEKLRRVNNERADYYSKLLRVYQQNYHQEEKRFHFVEANNGESSFESSSENRDSLEGGAERKNPWADLFLKWSANTDS